MWDLFSFFQKLGDSHSLPGFNVEKPHCKTKPYGLINRLIIVVIMIINIIIEY